MMEQYLDIGDYVSRETSYSEEGEMFHVKRCDNGMCPYAALLLPPHLRERFSIEVGTSFQRVRDLSFPPL